MHRSALSPAQVLALVLVLAIMGCTRLPQGIRPVQDFDLPRYLGEWHEVARLDHRFERGLTRVTATYSLNADGSVKVLNRGWDATKGRWKEAEGRAVFIGSTQEGRLKVSFFGPFYGAYTVMALDPGRYAMICGPDRSYLWILSRKPALDQATLQELVAQAKAQGFATERLIYP
jgi:apolipoprotein D and lipocalin family protein